MMKFPFPTAASDGGGGGGRSLVEEYPPMEFVEAASLPPGYEFRPTNEELIYYLQLQIFNASFAPTDLIQHQDIYNTHPRYLPGAEYLVDKDPEKKIYFFTEITKIGVSKTGRILKSNEGFWKPTQSPKVIHSSTTGNAIGTKTPLVYYEQAGKKKTQWLMQEYKLKYPKSQPPKQRELVLAVIYYHYRKGKSEN